MKKVGITVKFLDENGVEASGSKGFTITDEHAEKDVVKMVDMLVRIARRQMFTEIYGEDRYAQMCADGVIGSM